jgi:hypothetical protein
MGDKAIRYAPAGPPNKARSSLRLLRFLALFWNVPCSLAFLWFRRDRARYERLGQPMPQL